MRLQQKQMAQIGSDRTTLGENIQATNGWIRETFNMVSICIYAKKRKNASMEASPNAVRTAPAAQKAFGTLMVLFQLIITVSQCTEEGEEK